jgi:hypothetical protein
MHLMDRRLFQIMFKYMVALSFGNASMRENLSCSCHTFLFTSSQVVELISSTSHDGTFIVSKR